MNIVKLGKSPIRLCRLRIYRVFYGVALRLRLELFSALVRESGFLSADLLSFRTY